MGLIVNASGTQYNSAFFFFFFSLIRFPWGLVCGLFCYSNVKKVHVLLL